VVEFARRHDVDPAASVLVGCRPAHRTLAATLGAQYLEVADQAKVDARR
jgi:hypothetical protein